MNDELVSVTISALEHFSYCPRQCAIIHVERTFDDNVFTERGNVAHRKTQPGTEPEGVSATGCASGRTGSD